MRFLCGLMLAMVLMGAGLLVVALAGAVMAALLAGVTLLGAAVAMVAAQRGEGS
jgi:hypothetical protein